MGDRLRVDVDGGKYTVVMTQDGHLHALRYGEPWRECVGDNLIGCMAGEIEELREHRDDLLAACEEIVRVFDQEEKPADREIMSAIDQARDAIAKAKP